MDRDAPRDKISIVQKVRLNSITLEKGNLGTHMRVVQHIDFVLGHGCLNDFFSGSLADSDDLRGCSP
jgi:hypothetical protein